MSPALEQHEEIKMRLRIAGSSLAQIARDLDVAATTVTSVSQGYRRSRRIENAIAAKLGMLPEALWRDRYPVSPTNLLSSTPLYPLHGGASPSAKNY